MKRIYILTISIFFTVFGCSEEKGLLFDDTDRLQFVTVGDKAPEDLIYSFVWQDETVKRDTVYIPLRVIGRVASKDRYVRVFQVTEYKVEYKRDNKGYIVDSIVHELKNKAKPGIHYVPFDDPEVKRLMKIRADKVEDEFPVILLRDKSLKDTSMRLRIQLGVSEDFQLGEQQTIARTLVISDKFEEPEAWKRVKAFLGPYSIPKRMLMIEVVRAKQHDEVVDDEWLVKMGEDIPTLVYWRGKFKKALDDFNNDPENIKSGIAPLREDPDKPGSALVDFPNQQI